MLQTFLEELAGQFEERENAPPFLYIDGRLRSIRTPEEVSKALVNVLDVKQVQRIKDDLGENRFKSLLSTLKSVNRSLEDSPFKGSLEAEFVNELEKDKNNFHLTIEKYLEILEAFKTMQRKPVIVIGTS